MEEKKFIQDHFSKKKFWTEFWTIILIAFTVIFITFILLAISKTFKTYTIKGRIMDNYRMIQKQFDY
jgi:cell division protein FtsL